MDILSIWQESIVTAWTGLFTRVILFLPVFFGAVIVFVIGIYVSDWLFRGTLHLLKLIKFSRLTTEAGLDKFLKKADISVDSAGLIALTVKWFVLLVFFTAATNILGLTAISGVINNLLGLIPKVLTAALIIAVGAFIANVCDGVVRGALTTVDHDQAKNLGQVARWFVLIIAILAGIHELQIAQGLVTIFFQGLTWTITLAVGLGVGLGSKDLIAQILKDWYEKLKK